MFTGIVEATAEALGSGHDKLTIARPQSFDDLKPGSSISVSGACLTVSALNEKTMSFDVVPETTSKTTLGNLKKGDKVNLERAVKTGERLDGHIVQGHVEGTGEVMSSGETLVIRVPHELLKSIQPKGSIAIDGVSLTVATIEGSQISLSLIPHTLTYTTIGDLKKGNRVNVETDIMIRSHAHAR